jgi:molecular chaperone GrpE
MEEQEQGLNEAEQRPPEQLPEETPGAQSGEDPAQKLAEAEKQVEYYKDLLLRKVAEFDNFKKRAESESTSVIRYAKADVIEELLPIVDDFERSLKLSKDRRESEAFVKGIDLIHQKLLKFLETQGVKQIDSLGKEFDVHYHDALLQIPRDDVPPHTVVEVVERGYMLDERVLRHAKVIVSMSPPDDGSAGQTGKESPVNVKGEIGKKPEN